MESKSGKEAEVKAGKGGDGGYVTEADGGSASSVYCLISSPGFLSIFGCHLGSEAR